MTAKQITSWQEKYEVASTDKEKDRLIEGRDRADNDQQQKALETRVTKEHLIRERDELIKLQQSSDCYSFYQKMAAESLNKLSPVTDNYEAIQKSNNIPRAKTAAVMIAAPWVGRAVAPVFGDGVGKMMLTTGTIGAGANAGIQYLTMKWTAPNKYIIIILPL
ncbi:hypothetical protein [Xenorhabdus sp. SGI246]|uniref:hypothetical protein n=1 Tax=Xenorhabdus sp. SGI246 TaxID=3158263 RepID=UPI00349FBD1D